MSFPKYPAYKNSGVEWLGEVPEHWQVKALRYLTICLDGKRIPLNGEQRADKQGSVPYWGANAVMDYVDEALFDEELLLIGEDGAPFLDPFKPVAFYSTGPIWPNNHIHVLRSNRPEWTRFLVYAMNTADYSGFIEGSTRQKLNQSSLMGMPVCFPDAHEITQIARFLDHETARIDALIEEQQRLIELLKEKRQAVISHAVTKGLDPSVPKKDSGVEWLGEVPAHWVVKPVKFSADIVGRIGFRGYTTEDIVDEGDGAITLSPSNMVQGRMNFDKVTYISWDKYYESPEIQLQIGDVVLVKTGSTYGRAAYIDSLPTSATINPQLAVFKKIKIESAYLYFLFESSYLKAMTKNSNTGGTMPTMTQEAIGNYKIPTPSKIEQKSIISFIIAETKYIDDLICQATQMVDLATERRSALISAAVTGKIDLRGWQPPARLQAPELEVEAV